MAMKQLDGVDVLAEGSELRPVGGGGSGLGMLGDALGSIGDVVATGFTYMNPLYWGTAGIAAIADAVTPDDTIVGGALSSANDAGAAVHDWIEEHPLESVAIVATGAVGGAFIGGSTGLLAPVADLGATVGLGGATSLAEGAAAVGGAAGTAAEVVGTATTVVGAGVGVADALGIDIPGITPSSSPPSGSTPTPTTTPPPVVARPLTFWEWLGELGAALFG